MQYSVDFDFSRHDTLFYIKNTPKTHFSRRIPQYRLIMTRSHSQRARKITESQKTHENRSITADKSAASLSEMEIIPFNEDESSDENIPSTFRKAKQKIDISE